MIVNTNMNALTAHNAITKNTALSGNSMEKISSGLRITKAGDDAAGLAISEKMRSQIRGLDQASRNVQDGISMVQTQEGALEEAGNIAHRMRELAVQAGNDTLSAEDRVKISTEINHLGEEMLKIAQETKFNDINVLNGTTATTTIQAGATDETRTINNVDLKDIAETLTGLVIATDTGAITGTSTMAVDTNANAQTLIENIDTALEDINTGRANMGAIQNRLEYTQSNLTTSSENLTAAESRIRDVDVAKEMVNLSKLNILSQASQSMISQANQQPQNVLQLLR